MREDAIKVWLDLAKAKVFGDMVDIPRGAIRFEKTDKKATGFFAEIGMGMRVLQKRQVACDAINLFSDQIVICLLYTSPSPRDA